MYSGNIFNNLDVKTPLERISNVLNMLKPVAIVTSCQHVEKLDSVADCPIIDLDKADWQTATLPLEVQERRLATIIDTTPFGLVNTSGSTGTPKSVLLSYGGISDYTQWAIEKGGFSSDTVAGVIMSVVFDVYIFEQCLMMMAGSSMVLLDKQLAMFPVKMMTACQEKGVNFLFWVPTVLTNVAKLGILDKYLLPNLRVVWFAGEVMPTVWINKWRQVYPQVVFANLYGPCEITITCTYYELERELADDEPVPMGSPRENVDVFLLDYDNNELCAPGVEGEICVGGSQLALGYYNNPEKSAEVFVQNPTNHSYYERIYRTGDVGVVNERGEMIFLGRRDSLIKIHGNRVELGEIEHVAVNVLQVVANCAIAYDHERSRMIMFYEGNDKVTATELKKALATQLPSYMLPSEYVAMSQLPHNPNGKIDRNLLKTKVKEGKY